MPAAASNLEMPNTSTQAGGENSKMSWFARNNIPMDQYGFCIEADYHAAQILAGIMKNLSAQAEQLNIEFKRTGISAMAMDSAQVALISFEVPAKQFAVYQVNRPASCGVKIAEFGSAVGKCTPEDHVTIMYGGPEGQHMNELGTLGGAEDVRSKSIYFSTVGKNSDEGRFFSLTTQVCELEIEEDGLDVPAPTGQPHCVLSVGELNLVLASLEGLDAVHIRLEKRSMQWSSRGDGKRAGGYTFYDDGLPEAPNSSSRRLKAKITSDIQRPIDKTFSAKYLKHFAAVGELARSFNIWIHEDHPCCFAVYFGDDKENGHMYFYVAPQNQEN